MNPSDFTRRHFLKLTGISIAAMPLACIGDISAEDITIQQAIDLIIQQIPGGKKNQTVDTVKSGDPNQKLTGIATTFLATVDVIRQAAEKGINFIITHEPTYYNHLDDTDWLENDPVYAYKKALLDEHNIVVWRFHDYWHSTEPDGILHGFLDRMGWQEYLNPELANTCKIPAQPMKELAVLFKNKLDLNRIFMVGNPDMSCAKIGLLPGAWGRGAQIDLLQKDIDLLVVGEVSEWETSEYVRDAAAAGMNKGLIILGHAQSEEPGMFYLVEWLKQYLPQIKTVHIPSKDAFIPV